MSAPDAIRRLVERFEKHQHEYRHHKNETELRREFLDPFFVALGWDVANEKDYDERHKEVIHEPSVEVAGQGKKADYAFRTGVDKFDFLVEAKKPSVSIESAPEPAYQLRRYGWSAKLPVNILTDFEHLAVYDCRQRPNPADKVAAGRILLIHYKEYETRWDEIAAIFSPEAVRRGAFEQYVAGTKGKKGTAEVDDVFLEEIERWRDLLARNIALRNPEVANERQMNYAVQMTIDRIIFLRICEDRGIEPEGQLRDIAAPLSSGHPPISELRNGGTEGGGVYAELVRLFKRADQKYNSGLFHFSKEKGWDSPEDTFTPGLLIDDKVLKDILRHLYYPDSPYAFSYLSADILGQVYERFLGKVIRLTAGHQAKVEEKPEVRKAGGVYYTPTYIVDYIVHNTVGKLLEGGPTPSTSLRASPGPFAEHPAGTPDGRTPSGQGRKMNPKEAAALKVLDPACGSGSFLLGAYQYLLDWHLAWYSQNDPEKWAQGKDPARTPSVPAGHLPHFPKENGGGRVGVSWRLTTAEKKRILLNNIHGVDIDAQAVEVTKLSLLLKVLEGETGQLTLGIERALPDLSRNIQCGNSLIGPDYYESRQLGLGLFADEEERYRVNAFDWQTAFPQVFTAGGFDAVIGNPPYGATLAPEDTKYLKGKFAGLSRSYDTYELFLVHGSRILSETGRMGMIIPASWLTGESYKESRHTLTTSLYPIAAYAMPFDIFEAAYIDTAIVVFAHTSLDGKALIHFFPKRAKLTSIPDDIGTQVNVQSIRDDELNRLTVVLSEKSAPVLTKLKVTGLTFGNWFQIQRGVQPYSRSKHTETQIKNKFLHATEALTLEYMPELQGNELSRYWSAPNRTSYLRYCDEIASSRSLRMFQGQRIVIRRLLTRKFRLQASVVTETMITTDNVLNAVPSSEQTNAFFALGVLNSKLISWLYVNTSMIAQKDDFPQVHISALKALPIPICDKPNQQRMVSLVERMLSLHKQAAKTPQEQEMLRREIESTDGQIDRLVYELYGLSEEEIKIVEAK
jgi:predicted type IV restriction endonuclease